MIIPVNNFPDVSDTWPEDEVQLCGDLKHKIDCIYTRNMIIPVNNFPDISDTSPEDIEQLCGDLD